MIKYTAIVLDKDSVGYIKFLLGNISYKNVYLHHTTLEFGENSTTRSYVEGQSYSIPIVGYLKTDKLEAFVVDADSANKHSHITISTNIGVTPVQSNDELDLHYDKIEWFSKPIVVSGVCKTIQY